MKPKGYILFLYYEPQVWEDTGGIEMCGYHTKMSDLMNDYDVQIGDKWDVENRDKIHFFYLDLRLNKYIVLPKFKKDYIRSKGFDQDESTEKSKKIFKIG